MTIAYTTLNKLRAVFLYIISMMVVDCCRNFQ